MGREPKPKTGVVYFDNEEKIDLEKLLYDFDNNRITHEDLESLNKKKITLKQKNEHIEKFLYLENFLISHIFSVPV